MSVCLSACRDDCVCCDRDDDAVGIVVEMRSRMKYRFMQEKWEKRKKRVKIMMNVVWLK
jgi:hypothetical protein